jgi:hypothetical protein
MLIANNIWMIMLGYKEYNIVQNTFCYFTVNLGLM